MILFIRWPKCLATQLYKKVGSWRALYSLREYWEHNLPCAVSKATQLLFHKEATPDSILPALFGPMEQLHESTGPFAVDCIVDELFQLCIPLE